MSGSYPIRPPPYSILPSLLPDVFFVSKVRGESLSLAPFGFASQQHIYFIACVKSLGFLCRSVRARGHKEAPGLLGCCFLDFLSFQPNNPTSHTSSSRPLPSFFHMPPFFGHVPFHPSVCSFSAPPILDINGNGPRTFPLLP